MKKNNKQIEKTEKTFDIIIDLTACKTDEDIINAIKAEEVKAGLIKMAVKEAVKENEKDTVLKRATKSIKRFFHIK